MKKSQTVKQMLNLSDYLLHGIKINVNFLICNRLPRQNKYAKIKILT